MKNLDKKLKVGILGGTGMVGQRFVSLLERPPLDSGRTDGHSGNK